MADCFVCTENARPDLPPRDRVVVTDHWRVAHAFDTSLPGWLVLDAREHVTALDELPPAAHAELGDLLGRLTAALRAHTGCAKTYVMQFSEAEGFGHLHVHLVPRPADLPDDSRGPGVLRFLGPDAAGEQVPEDERDRIAMHLAALLRPGALA
ncbi:HIT family protein [Phycicoccus sp. BSK3Z-2]|uniref:HIT family protein n=1 Tax=Phycicoccus avicenniae TaxID=2828860 RepID=A0A941I1P8_9MICO|nr:HIT family protein [Phycicoccus avicenniae]MBR7744531.1 HIT family protein [Phycicoccus avicenniae]